MKRNLKILFATLGMVCSMALTSFAGQWIADGSKWLYMTDDGNFAKDTWLWLDENHDTKAELYHFDANGVLSQNTAVNMSENTNFGMENLVVNVDKNGAATDYTITYFAGSFHQSIEKASFPTTYSITVDPEGNYVYSLDVDHYDFNEIKTAYASDYTNFINTIEGSGDGYRADVDLIVFADDSESVLMGELCCSIKTTAKFAKNCKARSWSSDSYRSISALLRDEIYCNYLEVESVDADGYITKCIIAGVG